MVEPNLYCLYCRCSPTPRVARDAAHVTCNVLLGHGLLLEPLNPDAKNLVKSWSLWAFHSYLTYLNTLWFTVKLDPTELERDKNEVNRFSNFWRALSQVAKWFRSDLNRKYPLWSAVGSWVQRQGTRIRAQVRGVWISAARCCQVAEWGGVLQAKAFPHIYILYSLCYFFFVILYAS